MLVVWRYEYLSLLSYSVIWWRSKCYSYKYEILFFIRESSILRLIVMPLVIIFNLELLHYCLFLLPFKLLIYLLRHTSLHASIFLIDMLSIFIFVASWVCGRMSTYFILLYLPKVCPYFKWGDEHLLISLRVPQSLARSNRRDKVGEMRNKILICYFY